MLQSKNILAIILMLILACSSEKKASLPVKMPAAKNNLPAKVALHPNPEKVLEESGEIRLSGQVSSLNQAVVGFQTAGVISRVEAKPGMFFKKGQVLAQLDDRDYLLREQMAKLQRDQAANQKILGERDFKIEQQLREENINAPVQLENSQKAFENSSLALAIAEANLKIAQKQLYDSKLRAPYDCVVVKQIKFVGQSTVGSGDNMGVLQIAETGTPELYLNAPESLLGRIQKGDSLQIFFPALKLHLPAKVVRFVPVISESTRTFLIVAQLNETDKRVVPGYFIEGILKLKSDLGQL